MLSSVMHKEIAASLSLAFTLLSFCTLWMNFYQGRMALRLHAWTAQTVLTLSAAFILLIGGAGPGGWAMVLAAWLSFPTLLVALLRGQRDIRKHEMIALALALASLPLWAITHEPVLAVALVLAGEALLFRASPASWMGLRTLAFLCILLAIDQQETASLLYAAGMMLLYALAEIWNCKRKSSERPC